MIFFPRWFILLNSPSEISLQFTRKINLVDRINLFMANSKLAPVCFHKIFDKSVETITLSQLHEFHKKSKTDGERRRCFNSNIIVKLRLKSLDELIHLHMDPKNYKFVANDAMLHSLKREIIISHCSSDEISPALLIFF